MQIPYLIYLSIILFFIGVIGVLVRRNLIIIFLCIEIMLNAVNLLLVSFANMHQQDIEKTVTVATANPGSSGQVFVFFIMVVAAAEVAIGLAIIILMYKNMQTVFIDFLNRLKH